MKSLDNIKNRLLDIELPSAPPESIDSISISLVIVFVLITVAIVAFILQKTGYKYKRALSLLKKELLLSQVSEKIAAYRLAEILKSAHKTKYLSADTVSSRHTSWPDFIVRLSRLRYSPDEINLTEVIKLIDEARSWTGSSGR